MNLNISLDTTFQRQKDIVYSFLDQEIMLLNPNSGQYYSFNKVGAFIWELMSKPITLKEIILNLQIKFEVETTRCEFETKKFLITLLDKQLIELV